MWCLFLISLHTCVLEACYCPGGGKQVAEQWVWAYLRERECPSLRPAEQFFPFLW